MINLLKILLTAVLILMICIVINTSLESNLFEQWNYLASIPWMRATLWDFYANILVIFLWVCYKEKNILYILMWAVLFFCLGSIATIGYVLIQLFKLKSGESVSTIFINKNQ